MKRLILSFLFCFSFQLLAGPRVELIRPSFSGTGCPKGSADAMISADAKTINIFLDRFSAEADVNLGSHSASKICETIIRVKVPHGFSLAIERVKYNGLNDLPFGSNGQVMGDHFFNDEELVVFNKRYYGSTSSPFNMSARIPYHSLSWTPCGEEAVIASKSKIVVTASKSLHPASVQVDDHDTRPGISYDLLWRSCKEPLL